MKLCIITCVNLHNSFDSDISNIHNRSTEWMGWEGNWRSSGVIPLGAQPVHLDIVAWDHIQAAFEYLQEGDSTGLSAIFISAQSPSQWKVFSDFHREPLLPQFVPLVLSLCTSEKSLVPSSPQACTHLWDLSWTFSSPHITVTALSAFLHRSFGPLSSLWHFTGLSPCLFWN